MKDQIKEILMRHVEGVAFGKTEFFRAIWAGNIKEIVTEIESAIEENRTQIIIDSLTERRGNLITKLKGIPVTEIQERTPYFEEGDVVQKMINYLTEDSAEKQPKETISATISPNGVQDKG